MAVLDDFDDGDIDEWAGETSLYSASTAEPFEGTHALEIATSSSTNSQRIYRTDVTWGPDDSSTLQGYINREHSVGIGFGVQGESSLYMAQLMSDRLRLALFDNGFTALGDSTTFDATGWIRVVVAWGDDITATAYDTTNAFQLGTVSVTDSTYGAGGIAVDTGGIDDTSRLSRVDTIETIPDSYSSVLTQRDVTVTFEDDTTAIKQKL